MSEEINKKVNQLRAFFKKNQAENHPIKNHPLNECEDYVKELYFDMLCVMAQYENEDIENQNKFIQRIMAGCNATMSIAEHIKRAMSLTVENIAEFLKQCRDNELSDIFFMDCLLISCGNGTPNKKQVEFLAEIADVLGFDKNKVKFMSELAVAVLEQAFEKLKSAVTSYDELKDETENTSCYIQPIVDMNVVSTDKKKIFYSLKLTEKPLFSFEKYNEMDFNKKVHEDTHCGCGEFKALEYNNKVYLVEEYDGEIFRSEMCFDADEYNSDANSGLMYECFSNLDQIVFENQFLNKAMKFISVKSIIFKNCIIDNSRGAFCFDSVNNVTIDESTFTGTSGAKRYDGGALYFIRCTKTIVNISNSSFYNYELWENKGGIAYSCSRDYNTYLKFTNCEFNNCVIHCLYGDGTITYNCDVEIDKCSFSNCTSPRYLFSSYSNFKEGQNKNQFIGCSDIR